MSKQPVSKAEFARRCGVSRAAVTKFFKGPGKEAVNGQYIDLNHPKAQEYYQGKTGGRPKDPVFEVFDKNAVVEPKKPDETIGGDDSDEMPDDIDSLKRLKEKELIREKRIKNALAEGKLVNRKMVEVGVIDPFNAAHVKLMTDGAKTITAAVLAKFQAGVSEQEIEVYVSGIVGSFIRPVKSKVARNLASVSVD